MKDDTQLTSRISEGIENLGVYKIQWGGGIYRILYSIWLGEWEWTNDWSSMLGHLKVCGSIH